MVRAAARVGLRKVRQRYGTDDFAGAFGALAGSQTTSGLMRWEPYSSVGAIGNGSYFRTGTGEARPNTTTGPGDGDAVAVVDTGYCDGWLSTQLLDGLPGYGGIIFRLTDGNNWWQLYTDADKPPTLGGDIFLTKMVAGVATNVWTLNVANSVNYGDVLRVHLAGTTIEVYLNTTLLTTVVDGHNNTATRHGLYGNTFVTGVRRSGAGLGEFTFSPTAPALPATPALSLDGQAYGITSSPASTLTVNLPAGVTPTDTAVAVIYEFPADTASVDVVSGLGGLWELAIRATNGDRMGVAVWVGRNLTAPDTSITAHSTSPQTNEMTVTRWSGLAGAIRATASAASAFPTVDTAADTGIVAVTKGRLVIGGVCLNRNQAPVFTDSPAAWTDLGGSVDFYPAYIDTAGHGAGNYDRVGVVSTTGYYVGAAVEIN